MGIGVAISAPEAVPLETKKSSRAGVHTAVGYPKVVE
jgi:hypothetical protein